MVESFYEKVVLGNFHFTNKCIVYRNYEYIKFEDWLDKIAYIYDATDWRYRCILEKYIDNNRYNIMSFESFRHQILS